MNERQAYEEAKKIFRESANRVIEITERAKAEGKWKQGLDSNKDLFVELDMETKAKLDLLVSMIDEE